MIDVDHAEVHAVPIEDAGYFGQSSLSLKSLSLLDIVGVSSVSVPYLLAHTFALSSSHM